jgi:hypothetical protein
MRGKLGAFRRSRSAVFPQLSAMIASSYFDSTVTDNDLDASVQAR